MRRAGHRLVQYQQRQYVWSLWIVWDTYVVQWYASRLPMRFTGYTNALNENKSNRWHNISCDQMDLWSSHFRIGFRDQNAEWANIVHLWCRCFAFHCLFVSFERERSVMHFNCPWRHDPAEAVQWLSQSCLWWIAAFAILVISWPLSERVIRRARHPFVFHCSQRQYLVWL